MDNPSNEYISEALKIANDLMSLAGDGDTLGDCGGSGILFAVCRDCAYKIRRHAENEERKTKMNFVRSNTMLVIFAAAVLSMVFASPAKATIILSTNAIETLGGSTYTNADLIEYDPVTDTSMLYFDESLFGSNENIDAIHVLSNGNIILSTNSEATLGGLSFVIGDLIEYNPTTDIATLFFDENLFSASENIDAVSLLDNGNIILSTTGIATLGGLSFADGDLVEYNPTMDIATLFFDESLFSADEDIDAVHILDNGNIILSTMTIATLGGLTFADGDLVEYNPTTDVATLYFAESLFSNDADIDAVYVTTLPEPATIVMLGLGMLVFIIRR